jgi:hypothetical protein
MATPRPIAQAQLDGFSIDENNQLYWLGKKVRTTLPEGINLLAWSVGLATVTSAVVQVVQAVHQW